MKEMKKISIITVAIIILLLGLFVGIKADVWNLFSNNNKKPDTTENNDKDDDKQDDQKDDNTGGIDVISTSTPIITINGDQEVIIEIGTVYNDLGAKAYDSVYGDLTSAIVVTNNVDASKLGTYTVTYNVTNKSGRSASPVTRIVKVVDTTSPEIILDDNEDLLIEAQKNGVFVDPTVVTVDDNSKEIITPVITYSYYTDSIENAVTVDKVDLGKLGNYIIHYNATDSSGNMALEVTRKVIVNDTLGPEITFSREGTDRTERNAYLTVSIEDFSTTTTKYIFVPNEMQAVSIEDDIDESEMLDLPENGIINPSSDGEYRLYVKSVDALGNESTKWSEGTFVKDIEAIDNHSIVPNEMNLIVDEEDYSYIGYKFTLNNFEDDDVVKIISKLYSGDTLLATNTVVNDDLLIISNPYEFINKFIISTSNKSLGTYLGETIINTMTGYTGGSIPNRIVFEVVTLNNGIYYSTLTNNEITPSEWSNALYLSVEDMIVDEVEVGENALELNVGVNALVESNKVSNIVVELYNDDDLIATNTANEDYISELNALDDGSYLTNFTTTFYLNNSSVDSKFNTTIGIDSYQVDKVPNNVKITVTTTDQEITNYVNLNLSNTQIDNWNNALEIK